jgi:hypothetical protein
MTKPKASVLKTLMIATVLLPRLAIAQQRRRDRAGPRRSIAAPSSRPRHSRHPARPLDLSDGVNSLAEMAEAVQDRGYEYFGVADHSQSAHYAGGLRSKRLPSSTPRSID